MMMSLIIKYGPWVLLLILLWLMFFLVHKCFQKNNILEYTLNRYKTELVRKLNKENIFVSRYGTIENKSVFYKLDRLILTSGIRRIFPWIDGEKFFSLMFAGSLIGIGFGMLFFKSMLIALFLAAVIAVALYAVVLAMSSKNYNRLEDQTSIFISLLANHAKGSSDIVTIMQKTRYSFDGPLADLISRFLIDAERTGNVDIAFDVMKESIDNKQLKTIIANIKNCSHYQANYEEVLTQMMGQVAASLTAREERKTILFSMKITLISISVASVAIVFLIGKGLGVDVKGILTENSFGKLLLFITGILYLFVFTKLFGTDK